jgi:IclR family pca regulon transcriptional regulator
MTESETSPEHVQSFARGLSVIRSFSAESAAQTLSEISRSTGLARATVRRLLLTLEDLGYVRSTDNRYALTPQVLDLGYAYLSSLNISSIAQPYLEAFGEKLGEASSVAVLDDTDVVYVARVPAKRIMAVSIGLGSRFPAFQTSMGRVLLAELDEDDAVARFERSDRSMYTDRTVKTGDELLDALRVVRSQGWALVDQELEIGLRSLAAPLNDGTGVIAAVNVSTHAGRTSLEELIDEYLPKLLDTARSIENALRMR